MRVLVVGGAGYVGCVLVRELLTRGHAVRVRDRFFFGAEGLAEVRDRIELGEGDVRALGVADLDGCDAVINLAGISSDPTAEFMPETTWEMNVTGAVALARRCREAGVRRYLLASSCSVYDAGTADDESDRLLDEESAIAPCSTYARSKLAAEQEVGALAGPDFHPVFLRKGTVFGWSPRMRFDLVINTLTKDALARGAMTLRAGGETWRPVVAVRDAALAYVACLERDEARVSGQVFNVVFANLRVCEMGLRIRETLRALGIKADIRAEYDGARTRSYRVSARKARAVLGLVPACTVEDAAREIVHRTRGLDAAALDDARHDNIRALDARAAS